MTTKRSMIVSLIGRPNVGKSSIFNRLMKKASKAITYDMPGVTRDRHYGVASVEALDGESKSSYILVDTGGFYPQRIDDSKNVTDKFFNIMTDHAKLAIAESDLVLFVVDVREGLIPFDQSIANFIRREKKKFFVIVNKYDSDAQDGNEIDFYSLGINSDEMFLVSAAHGLGFDALTRKLHEEILFFENNVSDAPDLQRGVTPREEVIANLALIGAPNAGKSTLLNLLVGSQRALVSDIPGTTVDPIDGFFDLYFGREILEIEQRYNEFQKRGNEMLQEQFDDFKKNNQDYFLQSVDEESDFEFADSEESEEELEHHIEEQIFVENNDQTEESETLSEPEDKSADGSYWRSLHIVDTAGIRKKAQIDNYVEEQSVFRSLRAINDSDIVIYMIDATSGISHQDRRLIDIAIEKGKSVIICLNKMDIINKTIRTDKERKEWLKDLKAKVPWLDFCDIIPISAKYNRHIVRLRDAIKKTLIVRRRMVPTGELNRFLHELVDRHPIVLKKSNGNYFKVRYAFMVKADPPTIVMYANRSKEIPEPYKRYLKNHLRAYFEMYNTPIHLIFRTGKDLESRMKKVE